MSMNNEKTRIAQINLSSPERITVNGVAFHGSSVALVGGRIEIDGQQIKGELYQPVKIEVDGDVDSISTVSGDVSVNGRVNGVSTVSGDVRASKIDGLVKTISGDVHKSL